jgi:MarR family transcriptional regulator, negative regulator of the multidrug operon emrRAB
MSVNTISDRSVANLLGALALGVSDRLSANSDAAALITLLERDELTIEWLRRIVGLSHSATVRVVDRLAAEGLVERLAGHDGRSVFVRLSARGRRVATRARGAREAQLTELVRPLNDEERAALVALADKLAVQLVTGRWQARSVCRLCDHGSCAEAGHCPVDRAAALAGE